MYFDKVGILRNRRSKEGESIWVRSGDLRPPGRMHEILREMDGGRREASAVDSREKFLATATRPS